MSYVNIELTDHQLAEEIINFFNKNLDNKHLLKTESIQAMKLCLSSLGYWKNRKRGKNIEKSIREIRANEPW